MPFIGRDNEIPAVAQRLGDAMCHLLTLVGPGGIGKTRLAVEVAKMMAETQDFADGVYFVDLQPVQDGDLLAMAMANSIGIVFSGSESPRIQLLHYLSGNNTLLILDNFEQLLDSVDLMADIVKIAPGIKLLVTSREALNIQEEWVWQVGGLDVPDQQVEIPIETFSAVRLFVERARRVQQDFSLAGQQSHIMHICQLVGGMPLALELAAGWTKALSCAEIVEEIQRSLNFLTTNMRNMPERHRSMQAVFDHSWRLLTDEQRAVFPKLSIFRGGFRREAAEQVAGATLEVLAGLVDKSFLRVNTAGRYSVHELMRQYGEEWLDDEARNEIQDRHCVYYAGFLHQRQLPLRGPQQATALDEIDDELDNVRASWEWAVEHGMRDEIHQSMHSFFVFCHTRAQAVEGERLFEMAVKRFEHEDSAILAYLFLGRTWLADYNGREVGVDEYPRAVRLAYSFWTDDEIALPFRSYYHIRHELISRSLFNDEQQEQAYRDFIERFRAGNQIWGVSFMLFCLGEVYFLTKRPDEAEKYLRESKANFIKIGDLFASCWPDIWLGRLLEQAEKYSEALQLYHEHQDNNTRLGIGDGVVYALQNKAGIATKLEDYQAARFYIGQALKSYLEIGAHYFNLVNTIDRLLTVYMDEEHYEHAGELASFFRWYSDSSSAVWAVRKLDRVLDTLAQNLPQDIYQQAVERGKKLHLRTILEQLQNELADYSSPAPSAPRLDALTERELEVLRLVAAGRSNRQIAHDLVLTLNTVKSHIHHIYGKLGVESRVQAVARARELNLL